MLKINLARNVAVKKTTGNNSIESHGLPAKGAGGIVARVEPLVQALAVELLLASLARELGEGLVRAVHHREADHALLHALEAPVHFLLPEEQRVQNPPVVAVQQRGHLQHPVPPLGRRHPRLLQRFQLDRLQREVGRQLDGNLKLRVADLVAGEDLAGARPRRNGQTVGSPALSMDERQFAPDDGHGHVLRRVIFNDLLPALAQLVVVPVANVGGQAGQQLLVRQTNHVIEERLLVFCFPRLNVVVEHVDFVSVFVYKVWLVGKKQKDPGKQGFGY